MYNYELELNTDGFMNILYITHPLNGLLAIGLAVGVGFFLTRRFKLGWRLWWIGAATFFISQLGHIPFNYILTMLFREGILPKPPASYALAFNAVILGLSAGLWEEWTRYGVYRWWARDARSWSKGLLMGAGHGGLEAIFVGVLVLYTFIQMVALQSADLTRYFQGDQLNLAQQQIATYWSASPFDSLLGAVERAFALPVQMALSIVVLQAFLRGHIRWAWLAVFLHAMTDAVAVYAAPTWGVYVTEALIGVFALGALGLIFLLRTPEPLPASSPDQGEQPVPGLSADTPEAELTSDQLDRTRYSH